MTVEITTRGLEEALAYFERLPSIAEEAAVLAVNAGARFGHTAGSRGIREQVALPARYLGSAAQGGNDRLRIAKFAKAGNAEAIIRGRERPTSLTRFVTGSKALGRRTKGRPVQVKVSTKGGTVAMPGAWLMRLKSGKVLDDETSNLGLALRLKPGQRINKREFPAGVSSEKGKASGLMMLYGPSVAQVFRDVARDIEGPVSTKVESEFVRQFERLSQ